MDPDGQPSRVERTFWAVWYYITGAVNRLLRPEITNDDTNSTQESAAVSEPADGGPVEGDASGRLADEDRTPAADSLLSPSRPLVAWEFCTADIHLDPDEESVRYETQPRRGSESKASEGGEGVREEAGHNDERPPVEKEDRDRKLTAGRQDETSEDGVYEEHANVRSLRLTGDEGDVEKSGGKAGAQEETERVMTPEDPGKIRNTQVKEEDDKEDEDENGLPATVLSPEEEEDAVHMEEVNVQMDEADAAVRHEEVENRDGVPQLASEKCDEGERQVETQPSTCEDFKGDPDVPPWHVESQMAADKSGTESEDEPILMDQEHVMVHRSQSDNVEEEEEGESTLDEDAVIGEENMNEASINQTISEAPEQRGDTEPVTEDDVAEDTEVQTKTREEDDEETESTVIDEKSDVTTTHHSVDGRIDDEDGVGEETLSGEAGDHENTAASVTVKPEGQTGQEMSGEFKNIAALPEFNFPTCEETQEGVPEYNNEAGPDENTTQRSLEGGDGKENQGSQLPEEVESEEAESLESSGADYSLAGEHMEEKQESTQYIKSSFDAVTESQESGYLFEEEEGELVVESMKTGTDVSLTEESDEAAKELHDGNEELLVECEVGEGLCDSRADGDGRETPDAAAAEEAIGSTEGQKTMETSFFQESVDVMSSDQSGDVNPNLLEDITEFGFLKHYDETEPKSHDDVGIVMEETGFGVEEAAEDEMPNKSETEKAESESSRPVDQPSHEVLETSHEETLRDTEAADEWKSKPEDLTLISADKVSESGQSCRSVIGEEILNLMALSQDADAIKQQEGPEPGQQIESSNEEREEISSVQTEKDEEQLVGSELVSDTSSSTVESGFLDQSLGEPELPRSTSTGSLHGICDMLASVSDPADVSELSTQQLDSKSQDTVMEETDEAEKEEESIRERDSGVTSPEAPHLNQESDKSPEDTEDERVESTETGSHKEFEGTDWKDTEEGDAESEAEMSALFEVEKATAEADLLEITASDSPNEIKRSESGPSDTALEDEMLLTDSGSQGDADTESERILPSVEEQPGWSDDVAEPSPGLNGADVAEQPTTEDWMQVDTSVLDFTMQRSRISVKNPRVKPPKDARSLLHLPSLDPTPSVDPTPTRVPAGVPLGGLGIGIKLPGLGGGFPVLKKTQRTVREEVSPDTFSQVDTSVLDFTAQKSRISVKNPRVKPPKDPRSLLHLPSVDPTPSVDATPSVDPTPSPNPSARVPAGLPLGGLGIGIKLPGLGAGFPVLKKTQRTVREENSPDTISQDAKQEVRSDTPKQEEAQHTPKWISPRHPGVGNPLMSELMTKLKKTTKE